MAYIKYILKFVSTVHTTLPLRTASQGVSFAFIPYVNTILYPQYSVKYVYKIS